jgi:glucose-1-phosphate cytidylyltransferase
MAYQSTQSLHVVTLADDNCVSSITPIGSSGLLINCGYFIFKKEIFRYISPGEELVEKPFQRLIAENQLSAYKHKGFWSPMDTFKDKQQLDDMNTKGIKPWEVWKKEITTYQKNSPIKATNAAVSF